jgi:hypothetical protein
MEEIKNILKEENKFPSLIIPCLHDKSLFQVAVMDDEVLVQEMTKLNVPDELKPKYKQVFNKSTMNGNEVKELLVKTNPCMSKIFEIWCSYIFNKFELSSVGIAIAHANYRRRTGITLDLSIWIN